MRHHRRLSQVLILAAVYTTLGLFDSVSGRYLHYSQCRGVSREVAGGKRSLDLTRDVACSTNRALGYALGRQFKDNIVARISAAGPQLTKAMEYISRPEGKANKDSLVQATKEQFPQYWEELEGIAEGSGVPEDLIVVLNLRQELSILADGGDSKAGADDCSDVLLKLGSTVALLGHNEDNSVDTVNTTYFVQAKLNGRSWTAYTYAGELSSAAWGFNDAGISYTLNAVYARQVRVPGVARNFVSRSILDAASVEDALARITLPHQATGHNINLIGLDGRRLLTIETGPGTQSDVKEIANETYFHANAYLRLDIPQVPGPSSEHRQRRAAELPAPKDREDILRILGDTADPEYPIWRYGTDGIYTLCTAFFDLRQETVEIFFSNPKEGLSSALPWRLPLRTPEIAS